MIFLLHPEKFQQMRAPAILDTARYYRLVLKSTHALKGLLPMCAFVRAFACVRLRVRATGQIIMCHKSCPCSCHRLAHHRMVHRGSRCATCPAHMRRRTCTNWHARNEEPARMQLRVLAAGAAHAHDPARDTAPRGREDAEVACHFPTHVCGSPAAAPAQPTCLSGTLKHLCTKSHLPYCYIP